MQEECYLTDEQYKKTGDEMERLAAPLIELLEGLVPYVQHESANTASRIIPKMIAELKRMPVEVRGGFGIVKARAAHKKEKE